MSNDFYVPLQLEPLQDLLGGLPLGTLTTFVGAPEAGKSTLMFQAAVEAAMHMDRNILVFDTENTRHTYSDLAVAFSNRYSVDLNLVKVKPAITTEPGKNGPKYKVDWKVETKPQKGVINVFVVQCPDIRDILVLHGRGAELKVHESGKVDITLLQGAYADNILSAEFAKFVQKHNVGPLLYDSLSTPVDEMPTVGMNFPARANLVQLWILQVHKLASELDIPVMACVHESTNPTNPFNQQLKIKGGNNMRYGMKYVMYVLRTNAQGLLPKGAAKPQPLADNERAIFVMRRPNTRTWARFRLLEFCTEDLGGFQPKEE